MKYGCVCSSYSPARRSPRQGKRAAAAKGRAAIPQVCKPQARQTSCAVAPRAPLVRLRASTCYAESAASSKQTALGRCRFFVLDTLVRETHDAGWRHAASTNAIKSGRACNASMMRLSLSSGVKPRQAASFGCSTVAATRRESFSQPLLRSLLASNRASVSIPAASTLSRLTTKVVRRLFSCTYGTFMPNNPCLRNALLSEIVP